MSTPICPLTDDEREEIATLDHTISDATERVRAIREAAAVRDGIDPEWIIRHR